MASVTGHIKTCQNCARGKIRCIRAPDASICDRCRRLDKACYFREARTRYNPSKEKTRVQALEAKVDQLLARVDNQQHKIPLSGVPDLPSSASKHHPNQDQSQDVIDRGTVKYHEALALLDFFRYTLMSHFPFVLITPETTLDQLRAENPFLLLAILTVSSYRNLATQQVLEETFQCAVADRMIFAHNPSMDVLQGLLVVLAWLQIQSQHLRFSSYLHLAWSVVGDLRLDQVSETQSLYSRMAMYKISDEYSGKNSRNEKRRALIGCYMLSSCRSTLLQKDRLMTRLSYIEKQAFELLSNAETASDRYLVHLVKLQQIFERIDDAVVASENPAREASIMLGFQAEIDTYKRTLSTELPNNLLLKLHIHTLQLFLCQACLFDKQETAHPSTSAMPRSNSDAGLPPHLQSDHQPLDLSPSKVEFLSRGLIEAKELFDYFFAFSLETCAVISHTQWLQTGFSLVLGCKLAVTGARYAPRSHHIGTLCSALNMPQILRGALERLRSLSKDRVDVEGKPPSKNFYEVWLDHNLEWFEQKYQLVHPDDRDSSLTEPPHGGPRRSALPKNTSSSQDPQVMGAAYGATHGMQIDANGSWPDFLWDISTEDILNGYMGFLDVPYHTL